MIVNTTLGPVEGLSGPQGEAWLGIPFAEPPVGELRFRAPQPAKPWSQTRQCDAFGKPAVQFTLPGVPLSEQTVGDEDCLTLNIWKPAGAGARLPVLVWVHGGGFVVGSGSFFDGQPLAASTGCIVVTLNYRLGPLGFLHAGPGAEGFDANPALLDIIAALQFVADNIGEFGGDPARVTVFGESAGAMLIGTLLAMPRAKGLFRGAALFSGAGSNIHTAERAADILSFFSRSLGVDTLAELKSASVDELRRAAAETNSRSTVEPWNSEAFLPVIDGHALADDPLGVVARGAGLDVPLLISTCREEMNLFVERVPSLCDGKEVYGRDTLGASVWTRLEEGYRQLSPEAKRARSELLTDAMFAIPAIRLAEQHAANGGQSWMMRIDTRVDIQPFSALGPCHGQDVYMLWETYAASGQSIAESSRADRTAARALQGVLADFATNGHPTKPVDWTPYEPGARAVMLLDRWLDVVDDPIRARRELWQGLMPNGIEITGRG